MWTLLREHALTMLGAGLGLLIALRVLRQQMRPSVSFAWLIAIVFIPYIAVPCYILFGGRKIRQMVEKKEFLSSSDSQVCLVSTELANKAESILTVGTMAPARCNNRITHIHNGEEAYAELCKMIREAERTISVMTFILGKDDVGRDIIGMLSERAREGVEVRFLMDALGCFKTRGRFSQELRDAGGQTGIFLPMLPYKRKWSANLRNHRKAVIVDGRKALIGGMNLADEYMGPTPMEGRWIDTGLLIEGPAVIDLKEVFISDWEFAVGEKITPGYLSRDATLPTESTAIAQVVTSGPDVDGEPLYDAILSSIYEARNRIWIVSPYFVPDDGLLRALITQARLGLDVRIVLPQSSNHITADIARSRYIRDLSRAGAQMLLYPGGMLHAKHLIFDDSLVVSGSMNFDMRSLYFNYELAVFLYSQAEIAHIATWYEGIVRQSTPWEAIHVGAVRRIAEDISALVSPLL